MARPLLRAFFGLMAVVFAYAAAIQLNDPDPILWVAVYGVAAVLCALAAAARSPRAAAGVVAAIAAVWSIWLGIAVFSGETNAMFPDEEPGGNVLVDSEEGREMGGLAIVAVTMALLVAFAAKPEARDDGP